MTIETEKALNLMADEAAGEIADHLGLQWEYDGPWLKDFLEKFAKDCHEFLQEETKLIEEGKETK